MRSSFLVAVAFMPAALAGRAAAQTDVTPPRIISVSPAPAAGVVDQVGLTEVVIGFGEAGAAPERPLE